jgi:hypothetical protein
LAISSDERTTEEPFPDTGKITTAVVTGEHPFDVPGLHNMFRAMPEVDYYLQHLDQFVSDQAHVRTRYDVVLFYNLHLDIPPENERGWWQGGTKEALEELGETEQGIVVLHHAIGAFPGWAFWSELVGIPDQDRMSGFSLDRLFATFAFEPVRIEVPDPGHPITRGLSAWDMPGELWGPMMGNPGPECHVLLTTDHRKARLKAVAWTRQVKNARVFVLQPGHDNDHYADQNFRTVLSRGIQWVAGRL